MDYKLSKDLQDKLIYMLKKDIFADRYIPKVKDEIKGSLLREFISIIVDDIEMIARNFDVDNFVDYLRDDAIILNNLLEKYKNRDASIENYEENINLFYSINQAYNKIYLLRDLKKAKDDIIIDLKYFKSEEEINNFNINYENAIKNKDINLMKKYLSQIHKLILDEWNNLYSDIDNMTDENFMFIGHSTFSDEFKDEFSSRYVSCSLFNNEFNDTFRNRFGFIFKPKNIVGANSKDMYVRNSSYDDEELLYYSSVPIIHHPKRIIDELREVRKTNISENNPSRKVYSEIVLDGFEPIGIFCFTNGAKELDYNYSHALKLCKSFPKLKLKVFDTMKTMNKENLESEKVKIIDSLFRTKRNYSANALDQLYRYELFFKKFEELKNKDYTEEDIKKIFDYNENLLSYFNDPEELFSGKYNDEEIKYILAKNYRYNIEKILKSDFKLFNLEELKVLDKYRNTSKCNKKIDYNIYFDGLEEFLKILNKVELTDEIVEKIKEEENLNFYKISKIIASYYVEKREIKLEQLNSDLLNNVTNKLDQLNKEIEELEKNYNSLLIELKKEEAYQEKYDKYYSIAFNDIFLKMAIDDLDVVNNNINKTDEEEKKLLFIKNELLQRKDLLLKKIDFVKNKTFNENNFNEKQDELNKQNKELSKHPFLNRKKIKNNKKESNILVAKKRNERTKFENEKQDEITKLDFEIAVLDSSINDVLFDLDKINENKKINSIELENIKNKLIEYFGCDNIEEAKIKIEEAKSFISEPHDRDYFLSYRVKDLKEKLDKLYDYVEELEKDKQSLL